MLDEALPDEAVQVDPVGPFDVWETEQWGYACERGTRKVVNVWRKEPVAKRYFKDGTEVTDEILDRMAAEAEAGLDISKLKVRPGRPRMGSAPAEVVPIRMDPELKQAVADRADKEQTSVSEIVREALRQYLTPTKA